ncbi:MAG: mucoidy inhibitor MuiA family protein [Bosea sp. (in: a-proteobacteria)]|uniref:mucoidy inhibitor MuiA family protein n=1 Tax=Bosea sp. (in: a-proteobacteria) TaxID=1871050 RepID=UPI0027329BE5|nr:mucoidy inhibitor MuiA family protein [Bosea sp. (in: a-proteobacteria)]MDP3602221.1 mucoidy inhibitor MuiA family protein [Bosea sp. (in: a-proteobacteria)]
MMTRFAAALVLAPSFAGAAEIELASRIDRVTVYPDGAVVTRLGKAELLQGASQIVLRGLPAMIDPASIRVEGRGSAAGAGGGAFSIGAVDVRLAPGEAKPVLDAVIEGKLTALRDEKQALAGRISAIEAKRATIERFGQTGPDKLGPDGKALPVADWPAVFEAIGTALVKVHEELRGVRARAADVEGEIAALERARPQPGRPGAPRRDVAIAVEAPAPLSAEFMVTYRVGGAGWTPQYEARLTTAGPAGKPALDLLRRAELRQRTGEDWADVALTLSTTRSAGGTQAPDLTPVQVMFFEPPVLYEARPMARAAPAPMAAARARAEADAIAEQSQKAAAPVVAEAQTAQIEAGAYQASFQVPGRATVPQDGSSKTVLLSQAKAEPALAARIVPELEEKAYLEASFVHEEAAPLLPGIVALHRDGSFIGRGRIGLVAPGDKVALGFGADDKLKVTRAPVRRRENEPNWLGQTRTDLREFRTVVKSLHAQPVKVTVTERIPYSESSAITVESLPAQTTPPTERQVGDKRGVSAWTFDLAPGAEKEIKVAYRIKWPGDREVTYAPQPGPGPQPMPRPLN